MAVLPANGLPTAAVDVVVEMTVSLVIAPSSDTEWEDRLGRLRCSTGPRRQTVETARDAAVAASWDTYNPGRQSEQAILDIRPPAKLLILATTIRWTRAVSLHSSGDAAGWSVAGIWLVSFSAICRR